MKLLLQYTFHNICKNKRTSCSIFIAVFRLSYLALFVFMSIPVIDGEVI